MRDGSGITKSSLPLHLPHPSPHEPANGHLLCLLGLPRALHLPMTHQRGYIRLFAAGAVGERADGTENPLLECGAITGLITRFIENAKR